MVSDSKCIKRNVREILAHKKFHDGIIHDNMNNVTTKCRNMTRLVKNCQKGLISSNFDFNGVEEFIVRDKR